jgi:polyhydroxyalkanoate synthesis regulator phasin
LSEPARDPALEAFVEAIETAFRARRGKDHVLAPRDFALARGFFEAGVPLATVLVALDAAFERDPATASLASLRRRIEELAPPGAAGRAARDAERCSLPELAERLDGLRERLLELPGRAAALPLAELGELADLVAVSSRPNWDYLRERLRRLDELVAAAAVEALSAEQARALGDETVRAAERQRGRVDARALEEATDRLYRQRARETLRLPRVGVD